MANDPMEDQAECPCSVEEFIEAASQFPELYISVVSEACGPCGDLKARIREADIPHPIVEVPADLCLEIADHYEVRITPTIIHLQSGKVLTKHSGVPAREIVERMKRGE